MSGTTGTPRTVAYFLGQDFQDGQATGSILPSYLRDLVVSINTGSILPPIASATPNVRVITDYSDTQLTTDQIVLVNTPIIDWAPQVSFNLITTTTVGTLLTIKDGVGGAASSPIVIVPPNGVTIDNMPSLTLSVPWSAVQLVWNGTMWNALNLYVPPNQIQILGNGGSGVLPGTSVTANFTHPADVYQYDVGLPFLLTVSAHDISQGAALAATFSVVTHVESGVASLEQSAALGSISDAGFIEFTTGAVLQCSFANVAVDGSSFSVVITNTSTTDTFSLWAAVSNIC